MSKKEVFRKLHVPPPPPPPPNFNLKQDWSCLSPCQYLLPVSNPTQTPCWPRAYREGAFQCWDNRDDRLWDTWACRTWAARLPRRSGSTRPRARASPPSCASSSSSFWAPSLSSLVRRQSTTRIIPPSIYIYIYTYKKHIYIYIYVYIYTYTHTYNTAKTYHNWLQFFW